MGMMKDRTHRGAKCTTADMALQARQVLVLAGMNADPIAAAIWADRPATPSDALKVGHCRFLCRPPLHDLLNSHGRNPLNCGHLIGIANPSQVLKVIITFRFAQRLRVETLAVDQMAILTLAGTTGLTAYDASYLWLSRSLGCELITLDRKLAAASA